MQVLQPHLYRLSILSALLSVMVFSPLPSRADSLNLGFISYDAFIPGDIGSPGVNSINILNFTGDPLLGGFALGSDFPSFTPVTFMDSVLSLVVDGVLRTIALGDIGPGLYDPSVSLLFSETSLISSVTFSATLSATSFLREDGTSFVAGSPFVSLSLNPVFGDYLSPGADFGVLGATDVAPIPEPGTLILLLSGLLALSVLARRSKGHKQTR